MEETNELDLQELFRRLKKHLGLIILLTLGATVLSALVSVFFIKPVYEAKIGVILISENASASTTANNANLTYAQNLLETYTEIAKTNKVASMASVSLNKEVSAAQLLAMTTVSSSGKSLILNLGVRNTDPQKAYKYVSAYAESFVERSKELIPEDDTRIMDGTQIPTSPVSPNVKLNVAIAFVVGLMASVGLALLLEYLNNTLVNKEDVERTLGLNVIGIIPESEDEKWDR